MAAHGIICLHLASTINLACLWRQRYRCRYLTESSILFYSFHPQHPYQRTPNPHHLRLISPSTQIIALYDGAGQEELIAKLSAREDLLRNTIPPLPVLQQRHGAIEMGLTGETCPTLKNTLPSKCLLSPHHPESQRLPRSSHVPLQDSEDGDSSTKSSPGESCGYLQLQSSCCRSRGYQQEATSNNQTTKEAARDHASTHETAISVIAI
jgi:hypothetical protein